MFRLINLSILFFLLSFTNSLSQPIAPFEPDETTLGLWHLETLNPQFDEAFILDEDNPIWFRSAVRAQNGNFLVGGGVVIDDTSRFLLLEIEPDGRIIRRNDYELESASSNICQDIALMEDGIIILVGDAPLGDSPFGGWMGMINNEGHLISSHNLYENAQMLFLRTVLSSSDGSILVGGRKRNFNVSNYSIEGELIWEFNNIASICEDIIQTSDGSYIAVGFEQNVADSYGFISKIRNNGDIGWNCQYGQDERIAGFSSAIEIESGYLCLGYHTPPRSYDGSNTNIWLVTFDFEGNITNDVTIERDVFGRCFGSSIIEANDGNFIITGLIHAERGRNSDGILLLKVNSDLEIISTESIFDVESSLVSSMLPNPDNTYTIFGSANQLERDVFESGFLLKTTTDYAWYSDHSDNTNNLHTEGIISFSEGVFGDALDLSNQRGGVVFIPDNETLRPEQFRIEAWFRMDSENPHEGAVVSKLIEDGFPSFQLYANSIQGKVGFEITTEEGGEFIEIDTNLNNSDWHYIAGDFNGERIRLIWDGNLVGTEEINSTVIYSDGPFVIGGDADFARSDLQFYGLIDEVMISNTPFDQVGVQNEQGIVLPADLSIIDVFPNPFNPEATISISFPKADNIELVVFNLQGRRIHKILSGGINAGQHNFLLNGRNLNTGIYFVRMESGTGSATKKVTLLK